MGADTGNLRPAAFMEKAISHYGGMVYRFALSLTRSTVDAQDVSQDVFVSLLTCKVRFKDEDHLRAWLLKAARHRCYDLHRQAWNNCVDLSDDLESVLPAVSDELEGLREHPIWKAMAKLSERDRTVLHLRYVEELDISEVARVTSSTLLATRSRLHRARKHLKAAMAKLGYEA